MNKAYFSALPYLLVSVLGVSCLTYSNGASFFIDINKLNLSLIACGSAGIVASFFCLKRLQPGLRPFIWNKVDLAILVWFIFVTLSSLITKKYVMPDSYLLLIVGIIIYYCYRLAGFNNRKYLLIVFLTGIGILTFIEGIVAVLQFFNFIPSLNKYFPITGTFKNPAPLALFLSSCMPFIYYAFCIARKSWLKIYYAFNLILSLFTICISGNRASYLSLIVIIGVYLTSRVNWFSSPLISLKSRWSKSVAVIASLSILILIGYYLYSLKPISADGRILIWTISYPHIFEHPFWGTGPGTFKENYSIWQAEFFNSHSRLLSNTSVSNIAGYVRLAYNEYLEILLEQGLLGLILFIFIFYFSFRSAFSTLSKYHRSVILPIIASLLTILAQAFISYPLHSLPSVVLMFILLAILNNEVRSAITQSSLFINRAKTSIFIFLLLLVCISTLITGVSRLENYNAYSSARELFKQDPGNSRHMFEGLSAELNTDANFLIDYSICLASQKEYSQAISNLNEASKLDGDPQTYILLGDFYIKLNRYEAAQKSYETACLIVPSLIYPKYAIVKILIKRGRMEDAKTLAKVIVNSKAKLPDERVDKMTQEMSSFLNSD